eukprot:644336-Amorphochlora_amoeboformis.AAC.1
MEVKYGVLFDESFVTLGRGRVRFESWCGTQPKSQTCRGHRATNIFCRQEVPIHVYNAPRDIIHDTPRASYTICGTRYHDIRYHDIRYHGIKISRYKISRYKISRYTICDINDIMILGQKGGRVGYLQAGQDQWPTHCHAERQRATRDEERQRETTRDDERRRETTRYDERDDGRQRETTRDNERRRETTRDDKRQRETTRDDERQRETTRDNERRRETTRDNEIRRETTRETTGSIHMQ